MVKILKNLTPIIIQNNLVICLSILKMAQVNDC